jgi:hypothetical protein
MATKPTGKELSPMTSSDATTISAAHWAGRAMSGLAILFLAFDAVIKLIPIDPVLQIMGELGYPGTVDFARFLGVVTLACLLLYAYPRTALLGAVLLTGLFGGAIASKIRIGAPLFSDILFGVYLGLFVWGGLYLRDARLRSLFPVIAR